MEKTDQKLCSKYDQKWWLKSDPIRLRPGGQKVIPFMLKKRCEKLIENKGRRTHERDNENCFIVRGKGNMGYPVRGFGDPLFSISFSHRFLSMNGITFWGHFELLFGSRFVHKLWQIFTSSFDQNLTTFYQIFASVFYSFWSRGFDTSLSWTFNPQTG